MLFPVITKVPLTKGELVSVRIHEGETIAGIVDDIQGDSFWLLSGPGPGALRRKFSFKIDQVFKSN